MALRRFELDRDLDYVIVTGAGASCPFGVNGTLLPTMQQWCYRLIERLSSASAGYVQASGLSMDLGPEQFEERLGRFLHQVDAFSEIEGLLDASRHLQPLRNQCVTADGVLEEWHTSTANHLRTAVDVIHQTLYELFAAPNVDTGKAAQAYGELLGLLGIGNGSRWVYATTNYDPIAEHVIEALGGHPDWGQPPQLNNSAESTLAVDRLIDGLPRYVPVLHLHGRVGWYRRADNSGHIYSCTTTTHQQGLGTPIVMLPDPNKVYGSDPVISSLWAQFGEALQRANRVFVLGHSLHDSALIKALRDNVEPLDRVAITVLASEIAPDSWDPSAVPVVQAIQSLGNAAIVPIPASGVSVSSPPSWSGGASPSVRRASAQNDRTSPIGCSTCLAIAITSGSSSTKASSTTGGTHGWSAMNCSTRSSMCSNDIARAASGRTAGPTT